jgi:hypothetical protein
MQQGAVTVMIPGTVEQAQHISIQSLFTETGEALLVLRSPVELHFHVGPR